MKRIPGRMEHSKGLQCAAGFSVVLENYLGENTNIHGYIYIHVYICTYLHAQKDKTLCDVPMYTHKILFVMQTPLINLLTNDTNE